jgi:alcohol dehydrogenase (cytochrome c)
VTYNGPLSGDRYSPLAQITSANVGQIRQVCAFDAPEAVNFQSGIVAVNGVLYFTLFNHTYAVDGATCRQKWAHTRPEPDTFLMVNRGVAYSDGRLFRGTGDAHVLAIDAADGTQLWEDAIGDPKKGESAPMAPIAWNGLVFAGNAGGDNFGVTGRIYALNAASGQIVWQFNTVPDSGPARATWEKASLENPPGGGATWTSYALDEPNGILYVPAGNPSPDFARALRPGDNLYTNALLALDAKTGRLLSYVQPIKGDFHDWDLSAPPALITTRSGRPFVAAGAKDGYVYNIDRSAVTNRASGEPDATTLVIRSKTLATTRENVEAPFSAGARPILPGRAGRRRVDGDVPSGSRSALRQCHRLVPPLRCSRQQDEGNRGSVDWRGACGRVAVWQHDPADQWKGWVTAFDAERGHQVKIQTPQADGRGHPATAGGLVFSGDLDGQLLAYDAPTGKSCGDTQPAKRSEAA